nr:hypothetical protein [Phocaeicola barnesiae]
MHDTPEFCQTVFHRRTAKRYMGSCRNTTYCLTLCRIVILDVLRLIEDITMEVAKLYGMIQPGESQTSAVRAVFFIDPEDKIRTILYYPLSLGRNFDEIKRVLIGLQTADNFGVALPADWRPGDEVIVPTAGSCGVAKARMDGEEGEMKCYDWFFCTKQLSKEEVESKLGTTL